MKKPEEQFLPVFFVCLSQVLYDNVISVSGLYLLQHIKTGNGIPGNMPYSRTFSGRILMFLL